SHLRGPILALGSVLALVAAIVVGRAAWVQVVRADRIASAASLVEQRDGGYRFEYNPRLLAASRLIRRGTIYDRNGLPLATSEPDEIRDAPKIYHGAGLSPLETCEPDSGRCYLLGGPAFHVVGDSRYQSNWAVRNSSYVERDSDAQLKGFDDRPRLVELTNPKTGSTERTIKRDYGSLLPLVRNPGRPDDGAVRAA